MDGIANSNEVKNTTERKLGNSSRKTRFVKVAKAQGINKTGQPLKGGLMSEVMDK